MLTVFSDFGFDHAAYRLGPAACWLAIIWLIETCFAAPRRGRLQHGATNLTLAALNGAFLFFSVGLLSVYVCDLSSDEPSGLLHAILSFVALDLFGYVWHRANHHVPILWRFHAVHHSDRAMDVTTSGRFHIVELGIAGFVRLPLLYFLGVSPSALLTYETTLVMVSMMHHSTITRDSTITLGRFDRIAQYLVVTPAVHAVHHSRDPDLYGCNYSSVLSVWDRLFRTFRLSPGPVQHGLDTDGDCKTVWSLLASPFRDNHNHREQ